MKNTRGRRPGRPLSERQNDVLLFLADGDTPKTIAEELGIAPDTVHVMSATIRAKLGAKTTAHAIAIAYQKGILK